MILVELVESRKAIDEFIDLPPRIYSRFSGFEPPLRMDRDMLLDPRRSAFWKKGKVRYWLARIDGKAVGRISAQIPASHPHGVATGAGMFGCLDAIDDAEVVHALLDAAGKWLNEAGCSEIFGPFSLGMNDEPGLLVEGEGEPPLTLYPWHPSYLEGHLVAAGMTKLRDLHSWRLSLIGEPLPSSEGRVGLAKRVPGLVVRGPDRRKFSREIRILCDVYNDGWQSNWGFMPLHPEDLAGLDQLMKWLVPEEAFKIVELHGEPVAVMVLIPNLFELTQGLGPRPGLVGWARLLWRAATHRFESGRIILTGVSKKLQGSVTGAAIAALLVDELLAGQAALNGKWVEAGWVLEDNSALIRILNQYGFVRNRTFRIYGKQTAVSAPLH